MAKEMDTEIDVEDFINQPNYKIYLKLMIDGKPSRPYSGYEVSSYILLSVAFAFIKLLLKRLYCSFF